MTYQLSLAGDPEATASGGVITVTYQATNGGDAETGGTYDKAVVADGQGNHVYDTSNQVHSVQAGDSYNGKIDQLQPVDHGTYTVSLILDSENSTDATWSGQVTVGS